MSSTAAVAGHGAHAEPHELGFVRTYIFSEDHKMIGRQFLFMALFMMSIGGLMAMLMRWARFRPTLTTRCSRCTPPS
jgi:cytochrome c oxidase subunit 1